MAGENEEKVTTFKLRYVICGIALLLFLLSIFSYNKADLAVLDGGTGSGRWAPIFPEHCSIFSDLRSIPSQAF